MSEYKEIGSQSGDTNLYGYVFNDPTNLVDPDGRLPVIVVAPVAGGLVGGIVGGVSAGMTGGGWNGVRTGFATGFIGGATAGLGLATGLGAAAATVLGLGVSSLSALPDSGANPDDVRRGFQEILKPPAKNCTQGE